MNVHTSTAATTTTPTFTTPTASEISMSVLACNSVNDMIETTESTESTPLLLALRKPYIACAPLRMAFKMNISGSEIKKGLFTRDKMKDYSNSKLKLLITRLRTTHGSLKDGNEKKQQICEIASDILRFPSLKSRLSTNEINHLKAIVNERSEEEVDEINVTCSENAQLLNMAPPSQLYTGINQIAGFLSGGQSSNGMKLENILKFNVNELEREHNYIQLLFPIHTQSSHNLTAPLVDQETIELYSNCEDLRAAHLATLDHMLLFFSLKRVADQIMPLGDFNHQKPSWLNESNHNQYRLTRMVQSLYLLGNEAVAESLLNAIISIDLQFNCVNKTTLGIWYNAIIEAKAFKGTQNAAQGAQGWQGGGSY